MKPIITIQIPSKSFQGDWHDVEVFKNGEIKCSCVKNGYYKQECNHIKEVKSLKDRLKTCNLKKV